MIRTPYLPCFETIHGVQIKSLQIQILSMQNELQHLQEWKRDVIRTMHRRKQHQIKTCAKKSVAVQTECEDCVEVDTFVECSDDFEYV